MVKKYLKTIEDIEALRNTDTKIYQTSIEGYYRFVKGVLCCFYDDGSFMYNSDIFSDDNIYIEVEDEPSEDWIGKLGWFGSGVSDFCIDVLDAIAQERDCKYKAKRTGYWYAFFKPLTPEEVEKYTGYKVVEEK